MRLMRFLYNSSDDSTSSNFAFTTANISASSTPGGATCSDHVCPSSQRSIRISRSLPRSDAKCGTSIRIGRLNLVPEGPISRILVARASPSICSGGLESFSTLINRQVIRVGLVTLPGGIMSRTPAGRLPSIKPPRASTRKLTKKSGGFSLESGASSSAGRLRLRVSVLLSG